MFLLAAGEQLDHSCVSVIVTQIRQMGCVSQITGNVLCVKEKIKQDMIKSKYRAKVLKKICMCMTVCTAWQNFW